MMFKAITAKESYVNTVLNVWINATVFLEFRIIN